MTGSADKGKAVCVIYLDFSKALDIVSHSTLVGTDVLHPEWSVDGKGKLQGEGKIGWTIALKVLQSTVQNLTDM